MAQVIVGLDIGTTKIACFVGKKNEHGKIEILSMGKSDSHGLLVVWFQTSKRQFNPLKQL